MIAFTWCGHSVASVLAEGYITIYSSLEGKQVEIDFDRGNGTRGNDHTPISLHAGLSIAIPWLQKKWEERGEIHVLPTSCLGQAAVCMGDTQLIRLQ